MCESDGRVEAGTVVDHIKPHKGDQALFWNRANWQTLCATHHSSDKQMLERSGTERTRFDSSGRVVW
jgi:5-methylcytosine-specific restriction protein A